MVQTYQRDGVICLRKAISRIWLDLIEQGIDLAINGASADLDIVQKKGDQGKFLVGSHAWRQVRQFKRFIFESPMADLAWPILQSKYMSLYYDFLLIKEAQSNCAETPWHQDHAYYPATGTKAINCWVALDSIPLATALRFYRGSHSPYIIYQATNFGNKLEDYQHLRKERPVLPVIDKSIDSKIITTAMQPGDMLVWNSHTLHSAPGNTLDQRRAAFSVNWIGDDILYESAPALDTYLDSTLKTGDPIVSEKFPLVRGNYT